jgi:hypothetical protein
VSNGSFFVWLRVISWIESLSESRRSAKSHENIHQAALRMTVRPCGARLLISRVLEHQLELGLAREDKDATKIGTLNTSSKTDPTLFRRVQIEPERGLLEKGNE